MNLRSYTAYLNLVIHCSMRMPPVSAFHTTAVWAARYSRLLGIPSCLLKPPRRGDISLFKTTAQRDKHMASSQDGRGGHNRGVAAMPKVDGRVACTATLEVSMSSPEEMEETGAFFGADASGGDVVLLWGDLGTGKTCFARGFVRARVGDPGLAVTSPSYLLDNTYEVADEDLTLHHMDLYRLQGGTDLRVLGIPGVFETCVCLVEWPDRLGATQPVNRLDVHLTAVNEEERILKFIGHGAWWTGVVEDFQEARRTRKLR
ncbi:unnamed protein product [Ectocarpus sp. 12 AP-2014]